jgi:hypothetical protein
VTLELILGKQKQANKEKSHQEVIHSREAFEL